VLAGKKVHLVFEAVDEDAHVYVKGTMVLGFSRSAWRRTW